MPAMLEHANITVTDADATAAWMTSLFGWHIRWDGEAKDGRRSIHIGTDAQYVALYQPSRPVKDGDSTYTTKGGLNHLAVVVDDIDAMERQVNCIEPALEN